MLRIVAALLLSGSLSIAHGAPVLWTLQDAEFGDGGTISGSFIYDADLDVYSAISITTTDALQVPLATFTSLLGGGSADAALTPASLPDQTGQPFLQLLYFQFPLDNAGGLRLLIDAFFPAASSFDGICLDATCSSVAFGRTLVDGGISGTPVAVVPVPAALLLPSALGVLALARRRRAR
jgi:hypothetical protein